MKYFCFLYFIAESKFLLQRAATIQLGDDRRGCHQEEYEFGEELMILWGLPEQGTFIVKAETEKVRQQ